jgi:spore maturation protein CgeB
MKILVAGDWYSDVHEDGVYQAYQEIGHDVFKFKWYQYFQLEENSSPFLSIINSFWCKFQDKFIVGPIVSKINYDFIKTIEGCQPDVISLYRATHITKKTLRKIKDKNPSIFLISHNEDDPFTKGHPYWLWRHFHAAIPEYDLVLAHRLRNVEQYENAGAKNVKFLRSWFAPERTHAVELSSDDKLKFECDVVFAGHFEDDGRVEYLEEIVKNGFKLKLFGPGKYWDPVLQESELLRHLVPLQQVWGNDYNKALCGAKVALCFMSKLNKDTYTRRCFEIPATKTVLVSEHSDELATLYNSGVEADFFKSKQELIQILHRYVNNEAYRKSVAEAGYARVVADGHDVISRMKKGLKWLEEIKIKNLKVDY